MTRSEQNPVAYFNMAINETVGFIAYEYAKHGLKSGTPLFTAAVDVEALIKERDMYKIAAHGWADENAPGGWIDNLRKKCDEYQQAADTMAAAHKVERDALIVALKFVESVYRQNFVVAGEPSSTLAYIQSVIAKAGVK